MANVAWEEEGGTEEQKATKPRPDAPRAALEAYVKAKYVERRFVGPPGDAESAAAELEAAAAAGDVKGVLSFVARRDLSGLDAALRAAREAKCYDVVALLELSA